MQEWSGAGWLDWRYCLRQERSVCFLLPNLPFHRALEEEHALLSAPGPFAVRAFFRLSMAIFTSVSTWKSNMPAMMKSAPWR